ncbi:glycosyltransferase involved in cell wall biosynthesis [Buttiauxella sp. BIGb0552]|uniref:glycosyltransferase family 2 protein n=1 Tax=Buttiauxella sp. BIGb0552 TaxID=2485120 RepID=UPI0010E990B0|nr:glycosyltransferase family 2 protein [Buttiauxella sp. BIGb0552]TDX16948.1 glycosyltransferase involved in cell wall biosynthesis [Buttiauxella sp. BIGb0552]
MKISLVVATINRRNELKRLFESLVSQTYENFEVIIVDQNPVGYLESVIKLYDNKLNLKTITSEPGLSRARNLGIKFSSGDLICFPDDDCWYSDRTLESVIDCFQNSSLGFITGRLLDENNMDCLKSWPRKKVKINKYNVWKCAISVTLFIKADIIKGQINFDETLGVGAKTLWGSGEETDFTLRLIEKSSGEYHPGITVHHPQNKVELYEANLDFLYKKEYSYGCGMGRVVFLNNYNIVFILKVIIRPLIGSLIYKLLNKKIKSKMYYYNFLGRVHGLTYR